MSTLALGKTNSNQIPEKTLFYQCGPGDFTFRPVCDFLFDKYSTMNKERTDVQLEKAIEQERVLLAMNSLSNEIIGSAMIFEYGDGRLLEYGAQKVTVNGMGLQRHLVDLCVASEVSSSKSLPSDGYALCDKTNKPSSYNLIKSGWKRQRPSPLIVSLAGESPHRLATELDCFGIEALAAVKAIERTADLMRSNRTLVHKNGQNVDVQFDVRFALPFNDNEPGTQEVLNMKFSNSKVA